MGASYKRKTLLCPLNSRFHIDILNKQRRTNWSIERFSAIDVHIVKIPWINQSSSSSGGVVGVVLIFISPIHLLAIYIFAQTPIEAIVSFYFICRSKWKFHSFGALVKSIPVRPPSDYSHYMESESDNYILVLRRQAQLYFTHSFANCKMWIS